MRKRQPHPEINFRLGKGRVREQRKAIAGLPKLLDLVGMTDEEKREFAEKLRAAHRESE